MKNTTKAVKSIYKAGPEHYHFNMACYEHGEKAVLDAMRDQLLLNYELDYIDATNQACIEFKMMKKLNQGEGRFKQVRDSLVANKSRNDTFKVVLM